MEREKKKRGESLPKKREKEAIWRASTGRWIPHDWFEGRSGKCTLLQFVDDATSKTTIARFAKEETTDEYLELLKEQLLKYGRPLELYVDKHSVFRVNREEIQKG